MAPVGPSAVTGGRNIGAGKAIVLNEVRKSFGRVRAVRGVSLEIEEGEAVAILGPNGAGKTSTISLMLGLLEPDSGTVQLAGAEPRQSVAAGRVGAMLQESGLTTGVRVKELLAFVRGLYPDPLGFDETLSMVGLTSVADRLVTQLSGGQAQRLRLGLALVGNPDVLVLDEPTAGMDVEARRVFWAGMHDYAASGRTVLFATHYLKEAEESAGRVIVMAHGRITADGSTTEVKAAAGGRIVRFTINGSPPESLRSLAGVTSVEVRGRSAFLTTSDSDATVRALLAQHPGVRDLEITGANLEDAFVALTQEEPSATSARSKT